MKSMDRNHPEEMLSAYLDGELTPAERASLEAHLATCPDCTEVLKDLRRLDVVQAAESPPPIPSDLAGRISRRVHSDGGRLLSLARQRRWIPAAPLAAAASLVAAGILWTFWQQPAPSIPPASDAPERATGYLERRSVPRAKALLEGPGYVGEARSRDEAGEKDQPERRFRSILPSEPAKEGAKAPEFATADAEKLRPSPRPASRAEEPSDTRPGPAKGGSGTSPAAEPIRRTLVLEVPGPSGYTLSVSEAGPLSLRTDHYDCSILVETAVAGTPEPVPPAEGLPGEPASSPEAADTVGTLFRYSSRLAPDAVSPSRTSDPELKEELAVGPAWTLTLLAPGTPPRALPRSTELRGAMEALVRQRHRDRLEQACGPLPAPLREPRAR